MTYRHWELWHDDNKRERIIKFWDQKDTNACMRLRREDFYRFLQKIIARFELKSVLDFGCGPGEDYPFYIENGLTYTGCDITQEMLDMFKARHQEAVVFIDDIIKSKQRANSSDFVVSNAVIQHIPRKFTRRCINTLVRITSRVLVMRWFGVGVHQTNRYAKTDGFIKLQFTKSTLIQIINNVMKDKGFELEVTYPDHRNKYLNDIMYTLMYKK